MLRLEADDRIAGLNVLREYFEAFMALRREIRVDLDPSRLVATCKDGRVIVVELQVQLTGPHGGESELLPHVVLRRSDG